MIPTFFQKQFQKTFLGIYQGILLFIERASLCMLKHTMIKNNNNDNYYRGGR